MKARHVCAVLGIAAAVGAVVFMQNLVATNEAQAPALAKRLSAPWAAWRIDGIRAFGGPGRGGRGKGPDAEGPRGKGPGPAEPRGRGPREGARGNEKALPKADLELACLGMQVDWRPGGRVLQGPPITAVVAEAPEKSPYAVAPLVEGRWIDANAAEPEIVCTRGALMRRGRGEIAPVGTVVTFLGEKGAAAFRIVGYLDAVKLPPRWPTAFANKAAFQRLATEKKGVARFWRTPPAQKIPDSETAETIAPAFQSDEGGHLGRAKPLLLGAAILTALCLLLNSLVLSVESRRREIALLRMVGLTRGGVVRSVLGEAFALSFAGVLAGTAFALAALAAYVSFESKLFPTGMAVNVRALAGVLAATPLVAAMGTLLALRPALSVRPLEATSFRAPRRRPVGMLVAFGCGFGAFVAVSVWGASLTKPFIPSPEWPDAIVSFLPGGVSSFDVEKLRKVEGIRRVAELQPLQVNFSPRVEMVGGKGWRPGVKQYRNALLLASDWLPDFRFTQGTHDAALKAIAAGDACVITEMMARARGLRFGDLLKLDAGGGLIVSLKIVGIVDLNWHMVTSRGLVRGLNRMPVNTDGPVFVSFDTLAACDPRPQEFVHMTHVWLDFDPDFAAKWGVFEAGRRVERGIVRALNGAERVTKEGDVLGNAVRLHARDEVADGTLAHSGDIVGAMARVPFLFLAVVSLGFVAMLVASVEARRRAFAVLRAVGSTRGALVRALAAEALRTAGIALLLALPLGALLGWLCTSGTRAAMANWGLPATFCLPWGMLAKGVVGAIVFVLAVALPTSFALIRRATRR